MSAASYGNLSVSTDIRGGIFFSGSATAMAMGGTTLLQCTNGGDERPAHLTIPSSALAPSLNATLNTAGINNIGPSAPGTWPPTLWQYPTAAMPALEPVGFPHLGVGLQGGLQLVRDPSTGHLLLIHAAAEQMQQAVVWPNYPSQNGPNIGAPPLLLPSPTTPPSLQLLSDINGARLVLTDSKRKQSNNIPIVKIEADCTPPSATIIASAESSKALQTVTTMTGSLVTDTPLLTTLHYYPHAPALVQISQSESTQCRTQKSTFISKSTSPVSCLTPPPDVTPTLALEALDNTALAVQDASNQTDTPETEDDPHHYHHHHHHHHHYSHHNHNNHHINNHNHHSNDTLVKQEQVLTSCQQQVVASPHYNTNNNNNNNNNINNNNNFDVVSSTVERPRVSISEVEVKKSSSHKLDTTLHECLKTEVVSSIKHDIVNGKQKPDDDNNNNNNNNNNSSHHNDDNHNDEAQSMTDEVLEERPRRRNSRVIEITEENCDSFHENLEFFDRRRDPIEQRKKHRSAADNNDDANDDGDDEDNSAKQIDDASVVRLNTTDGIQSTVTSSLTPLVAVDQTENVEFSELNKREEVASSLEPLLVTQHADSSNTMHDSVVDGVDGVDGIDGIDSADAVDKAKDETIMSIKSLDMPSIDCDDDDATKSVFHSSGHDTASVPIKREHDEHINVCTTDSSDHDKCLPDKSSTSIKPTDIKLKCTSYHVLENVVEKLKKNAAAQDTSQKSVTPDAPRIGRCLPRVTSNGLKKHILRFCETTSAVTPALTNPISPDTSAADLAQCTNDSSNDISNISSSSDRTNNINSNNSSNNNNNTNDKSQVIPVIQEKFSKSSVIVKPDNTGVDDTRIGRPKHSKGNQCAKSKSNVDLSGLELLSNSIAQLEQLNEHTDNNTSNSDIELSPKKDIETRESNNNSNINNNNNNNNDKNSNNNNKNNVDSPLGLLCALAEQRFMEEVGDVPKRSASFENTEDVSRASVLLMNLGKSADKEVRGKVEKRRHSLDENTYRNIKRTRKDLFYAFKQDTAIDITKVQKNSKYTDDNAADDADDDYTDSEVDEQAKILTSVDDRDDKMPKTTDGKVSKKSELDDRLADIAKKYKEKQKELAKLPVGSWKDDTKLLVSNCEALEVDENDGVEVEAVDSPVKSPELDSEDELLPSCTSVPILPRCNANLIKLTEPRSHIKLLDSIPSISIPVCSSTVSTAVVAPAASPHAKISEDEDPKTAMDYDTSSSAPTIASTSSAKKRKVGRPRKLMCTSAARHLTETIVAKKARVSYLLNSKIKGKLNGKSGILPIKCGLSSPKHHKSTGKGKIKPLKQTPLHNKNVISSIIAEKAKLSLDTKLEKQQQQQQVIKLKPKFKSNEGEWNSQDDTDDLAPVNPEPIDPIDNTHQAPEKIVTLGDTNDCVMKIKKKKRKSTSSSPLRRKSSDRDTKKESKRRKSSDCKECKECAKAARAERAESITNRCKLTSAHLSTDQLRVLTAMGGLFYAGRLNAVQAPDVYAITLDGERGNRPHIHSREEILRDAIVEVCPGSTRELPPGTRLCAYWSQQYRCLYPGTSVEPSDPDSDLDEKFVSVEFDDGDSGRIALDDIRLLQPDYPVVEYDPNPLLTLGKKRRQTSLSTDDKRENSSKRPENQSSIELSNCDKSEPNSELVEGKLLDEYRERKKLKKRRRDKLKRLQAAHEGKKKHKRHKCCEEHRKHKHRKHRKHKHKHSHHSSHNESSHVSGAESCSGLKSDDDEEHGGNGDEDLETKEPKIVETTPVPENSVLVKENGRAEKAEKGKKADKKSKTRERQESVESRSKMAAFLPARQLWGWAGKGYRRPGAKGRAKKQFFKAIQRGNETIQIGDSAVFLSTGRPDRPYIGKIESMWETTSSNMIVKVKWFYHPEETVGCPANLKYPGALFESPHMDENDVQTISHKCEVLPLQDYTTKLGKEPHRYLTIYDNNDIYYLAGYYDPTTYLLTLQPGVV